MNEQGSVANSEDSKQSIGTLQKEIMQLKAKSKFHDGLMFLFTLLFVIIFMMHYAC